MTLFIALVFVLAGMVKGVTGMGLPTVAVALLSLKMAPLEAAALLIVPSALTNVWQLATGAALYPLWRRLRAMLLAVCAGTGVGGVLLVGAGAAAHWTAAMLGALLVGYGLLGLSGWRGRVTPGTEPWAGPLAGAATGLVASVSGVFIMPAAPYLQALQLSRDELVQALGLSFTVSTLALALMLAWRGEWHMAAATGSLLALLPAALGIMLGQWLRQRMSAEVFRRCFFVALVLLGVHQGVRAFMAGA